MLIDPVFAQRVKVGVAASLTFTLEDQNGEPVSTTNGPVVTVDITHDNGAVLVNDGVTTTNAPTTNGTYTYALSAANNTNVNLLHATFSATNALQTVVYETVSDFYFSSVEAREFDDSMTTANFPNATVHRYRNHVEAECEWITGTAWVRRFARLRLNGTGGPTLLGLPWNVRSVRDVRVYSNATDYTSLTATELAAIEVKEWGRITRLDGGVFAAGTENIVVEVEHGYDRPPADLKEATLKRLRYLLNNVKTAIPDRATSFTIADAGVFSLATPGMKGAETGIPEVDAVYKRYTVRVPVIV